MYIRADLIRNGDTQAFYGAVHYNGGLNTLRALRVRESEWRRKHPSKEDLVSLQFLTSAWMWCKERDHFDPTDNPYDWQNALCKSLVPKIVNPHEHPDEEAAQFILEAQRLYDELVIHLPDGFPRNDIALFICQRLLAISTRDLSGILRINMALVEEAVRSVKLLAPQSSSPAF